MKKVVLKKYFSEAIVEKRDGVSASAFEMLFTTNVPHVLEMIFFSLDYESYKKCLKVCIKWRELLITKSFQTRVNLLFCNEVSKEQGMLSCAAWNGHTQMAKSLLSSGLLDVNANISKYVNNIISRPAGTLLTLAAEEGHEDVVLLLLNNGADPNKANNSGRTPLHSAASSGNSSIVRQLLYSGATPDIQDEFGWTPMFMARAHADHAIMQLLKKYQNLKSN